MSIDALARIIARDNSDVIQTARRIAYIEHASRIVEDALRNIGGQAHTSLADILRESRQEAP